MSVATLTMVGGVAAATAPQPAAHPTTVDGGRHSAAAADISPAPSTVAPTAPPEVTPGPPDASSIDARAAGIGVAGLSPANLGAPPRTASPAPTLPAPLPEPNRAAPVGSAAPDRGSGAVWPGDFPDPFVLRTGPAYYAYSTQVGLTQVPTIRSNDLVH